MQGTASADSTPHPAHTDPASDGADAAAPQAVSQQWAEHYGHLDARMPDAAGAELVCVPRALLTRYQELEWEDWRRRYAVWSQASQAYYAGSSQ